MMEKNNIENNLKDEKYPTSEVIEESQPLSVFVQAPFEEDLKAQNPQKKKLLFKKIFSRFLIIVSVPLLTIIILYFTFPYSILKEYLITIISNEMQKGDFQNHLSIKKLRPYWGTGISLEDLVLTSTMNTQKKIEFQKISIYYNPFRLFLGQLAFSLKMEQKKGQGHIGVALPFTLIPSLVSGKWKFTGLQSLNDFSYLKVDVDHIDFDLFPLFEQRMAHADENDATGMFLNDTIKRLSFSSSLSAKIELDSHKGGGGKIEFPNTLFKFEATEINIEPQKFSKSIILLKWDEDNIEIQEGSSFISQNIDLSLSGKALAPKEEEEVNSPQEGVKNFVINLAFKLVVSGSLNSEVGFLIQNGFAALGCPPPQTSDTIEGGASIHEFRLSFQGGQTLCQ